MEYIFKQTHDVSPESYVVTVDGGATPVATVEVRWGALTLYSYPEREELFRTEFSDPFRGFMTETERKQAFYDIMAILEKRVTAMQENYPNWPFPNSDTISETMNTYGIRIVHCFDRKDTRGGVTIAWSWESHFRNRRVVRVALAYCNKTDSYNKKTGTKMAVERWMNDNAVLIPLPTLGSQATAVDVEYLLTQMFYKIPFSGEVW